MLQTSSNNSQLIMDSTRNKLTRKKQFPTKVLESSMCKKKVSLHLTRPYQDHIFRSAVNIAHEYYKQFCFRGVADFVFQFSISFARSQGDMLATSTSTVSLASPKEATWYIQSWGSNHHLRRAPNGAIDISSKPV